MSQIFSTSSRMEPELPPEEESELDPTNGERGLGLLHTPISLSCHIGDALGAVFEGEIKSHRG